MNAVSSIFVYKFIQFFTLFVLFFMFLSYTFPIGEVVSRYGLTHHVYVDDKDIYIAFKPKPEDVSRAV